VCYVIVAGLLFTGEGLGFFAFVAKYPSVLIQLITFAICSAIGQVTSSLCPLILSWKVLLFKEILAD